MMQHRPYQKFNVARSRSGNESDPELITDLLPKLKRVAMAPRSKLNFDLDPE